MRARLVFAVVCLASSLAGAEESAHQVEGPTAKEPRAEGPAAKDAAVKVPPTWSVGAGVGYGTVSLMLMSPAGTNLGVLGMSQGTLSVEHAQGAHDWLLLSVSAGYGSQTTPSAGLGSNSSNLDREDTGKSIGGFVGLRHIFTDQQVVEVSGWLGIGGSWSESKTSYTATYPLTGLTSTNRWSSISALAGLAFDRRLLEGMYLRLNLSVLQAGRSWGLARQSQTPDVESSGTNLGLRLAPALELRMVL